MHQGYYLYIMTNYTNKVLYIGVTENLLRRIWEHKNKLIPGFTEKYNLDKLVYFQKLEIDTTEQARVKKNS